MSDQNENFTAISGMLKVEDGDAAFKLYRMMSKQIWFLTKRRSKFISKILLGKHTMVDAAHDLAIGRATAEIWKIIKLGNRLRSLQVKGGTAMEIDVLRMSFIAASNAFQQRCKEKNFYQDSVGYFNYLKKINNLNNKQKETEQ